MPQPWGWWCCASVWWCPTKEAGKGELITGKHWSALVKVPAKSGRHPLQLLYLWKSNGGISTNREESLFKNRLTIKWRNHLYCMRTTTSCSRSTRAGECLSDRTRGLWLTITVDHLLQWSMGESVRNWTLICYAITSCYAIYTLMHMIHHVWVCTDWKSRNFVNNCGAQTR